MNYSFTHVSFHRTHSAGQNFECKICKRTFIRESYLIRHHNRVHRERSQSLNIQSTINSVVESSVVADTNNIFDRYTSNIVVPMKNGRVTQRIPQPSLLPSQLMDHTKTDFQTNSVTGV